MHELSLAQNIIDIITAQAAKDHFTQVKKVRLELGDLVGVEKTALEFGFQILAEETVANGATLEFILVPAKAECKKCGSTFPVKIFSTTCKHCGSSDTKIVSGKEFRVKDLEVE